VCWTNASDQPSSEAPTDLEVPEEAAAVGGAAETGATNILAMVLER